MSDKDKVTLNGVPATKEEIENLKENQDKNTQIIEESKGEYKQRLRD